MPEIALSSHVAVLAQFGLASVLGASALAKWYYKGSVDTALSKLGIRVAGLRTVIGGAIAPIELVLAMSLLTGWMAIWAAPLSLGLVLVFNVVLWRLRALGYDGGCGCFGGKSAGPVRVVHLFRNALMLLAAAALTWHVWANGWTPEAIWAIPGAQLASALVVLGGMLVVYLLAGAAERLLFRAYW